MPQRLSTLLWLIVPACLFAAGCGRDKSSPASVAASNLAQLQAMAAPLEVKELSPADHPADRITRDPNIADPARALSVHSVREAAVYQIGDRYLIDQGHAGGWLAGSIGGRKNRKIRCDQSFADLHALIAAGAYAPLPPPPPGYSLRDVARLAHSPLALAGDGAGSAIYVLCSGGELYRVDLASGKAREALMPPQYLASDSVGGGLTMDDHHRLYISTSRRDETVDPPVDDVTIFRFDPRAPVGISNPANWFSARIAAPRAAQGGAGRLLWANGSIYVSVAATSALGDETDVDMVRQPGRRMAAAGRGRSALSASAPTKRRGATSQSPSTVAAPANALAPSACIWRLDARSDAPRLEVFATGLRDALGLGAMGEALYATDANPRVANVPDELNRLIENGDYGFPYLFSNWQTLVFAHQPPAPPDAHFENPLANYGPDGGVVGGQPLFTFDPHSTPSAIIALGNDFQADQRGTLLVARRGSRAGESNAGFDLVDVRLMGAQPERAEVTRFLAPLGRPVDLLRAGPGMICIAESSRAVSASDPDLGLPGRILMLQSLSPPAVTRP